MAFVGYRDFVDKENRIVSVNLTEDIPGIDSYMAEIKAHGGGDKCEDVFGGLEKVLTLDWKFPTRILIHVGDAPQHGTRYVRSLIIDLDNLTLMQSVPVIYY